METITMSSLLTAQPTKQQLADYANAMMVVNNYAYAITNQQMPVLTNPPKHYADFVAEFGPAKGNAIDWSNTIFTAMVALPSSIKGLANDMFNMDEGMADNCLDLLISDPGNTKAKESLAAALKGMQQIIKNQVTTVEDIETKLTAFSTKLGTDAATLANMAKEALDFAGADQAQIKKTLGDIETLKGQIAQANTLLEVSEIGLGFSIFLGLVGLCCCLIPGAQGLGAGIIVAAIFTGIASTAGTIIETNLIKSLQGTIDNDYANIDQLKQDIIHLNAVSSQFTDLYNANLNAQKSLTAVKTMWHNLDTTIEAVSSELTNVSNDNTSAQYQQAKDELAQANTNWQSVVAFANALAGINYSWQDAKGAWHDYGSESPTVNSGQVNLTKAA
jgi:hypothetical protein